MTFQGHTAAVTAVGWRLHGSFFFSSSEDGTVKVWDPRSPKHVREFDCKSPVSSVSILPNMVDLVSTDRDGLLRVWSLRTSRCRLKLRPTTGAVSGRHLPLSAVAVAPDISSVAAASHSGVVHRWACSRNTEGVIDLTPAGSVEAHTDYVTKMAFSPVGRMMATASADKTVRLWTWPPERRPAEGSTAASSTAASSTAASAEEGPAPVWTCHTTLTGHEGWVWDAMFNADGTFVVTGSSDGNARLWEVASGECVQTFAGHARGVTAVAVNDGPASTGTKASKG
jgi:target of rapamycin complex subunit LST8